MYLSKLIQFAAIASVFGGAIASPVTATPSSNLSEDLSMKNASASAFAINIGTDLGPTYAWVGAQSRCGADVSFVSAQSNFCSQKFALKDQAGVFTFEGCGGPLWATRDGFFYANCQPFSEASPLCWPTLKTTYHCA